MRPDVTDPSAGDDSDVPRQPGGQRAGDWGEAYSDAFVAAFAGDLEQLRQQGGSAPKMLACCIAATATSFSEAERRDMLGQPQPDQGGA